MVQLVPEYVDRVIGKRIQQKRKDLGYTADQLSELLGISQQQLSRYERGQNKINVAHLVNIATFLNTPIGWFFMDLVSTDGSKVSEFDQHWHRLTEEQKQSFVIFLQKIQR